MTTNTATAQPRKKKTAHKTKYTCPKCGATAKAKPLTLVVCDGCCDSSDELVPMNAEDERED